MRGSDYGGMHLPECKAETEVVRDSMRVRAEREKLGGDRHALGRAGLDDLDDLGDLDCTVGVSALSLSLDEDRLHELMVAPRMTSSESTFETVSAMHAVLV